MQDRPDAPELLDSLAAYLFGELRPLVPREQRFKVLVAANVCAVLARELRAGAEPDGADAELFRRILALAGVDPTAPDRSASADGAAAAEARALAGELASALRSGRLDDDLEQAVGLLSEHVRRKLDVARPGYAD